MKLKPEHLQIIKFVAMSGARAIRASGQECAPTLLLFNSRPDGELGGLAGVVTLAGMDKDAQAATHCKLAREPGTAAAVMIHEAWQVIRMAEPGQDAGAMVDGLIGHVAEQPDRKEILIISVMTDCAQWMLTAEIRGAKIEDAEFERVDDGAHVGRFIRAQAPQS